MVPYNGKHTGPLGAPGLVALKLFGEVMAIYGEAEMRMAQDPEVRERSSTTRAATTSL